ncbi:MAG: hypothetical protein ABI425_05590 [Patescibacteria group bacterium]
MSINGSEPQLRIALSNQLHEFLREKSQQFGLTMAAYVRNLIIQDLKDAQRPIYQAPIDIDESVKKKKRFSIKGLKMVDG